MTKVAKRLLGQSRPSKTQSWIIRLFQDGDEAPLNELYNDVFDKNRALDEWKWKFQSSPAATKTMIPLGLIDHRLVGMYPCVMVRWKIGETVAVAVQPVETAVQEDARDGKLIVALRKLHVERCEALGIAFSFGCPSKSHYKFGKRFLKYHDLCRMEILDRSLKRRRRGALQRAVAWLNHLRTTVRRSQGGSQIANGLIMEPVTHFDERFDRLWERASRGHRVLAVRDRQFLEWRYVSNPKGGYMCIAALENDDLVGYLILRQVMEKSVRVGTIADVLYLANPGIVDALLDFTIGCCLDRGVDYLRCGALTHTELYQALMRAGFRSKSEPWSIVYTYRAVDEKLFQDSTNWYFTLGDFDFDDL